MSYNNDVTYNEKWATKENEKWLRKCDTYIYRARVMSDVPLAWAKEVYELLSSIDKEFGIRYDVHFHYGLMLNFRFFNSFLKSPFNILVSTPYIWQKDLGRKDILKKYAKHNLKKPWRLIQHFKSLFDRGVFMIKGLLYNWWKNPKVQITQIKEKYGNLVVYHSEADWLEKHIDDLIVDCEVKLSLKGAYYPVQSFVNNCTSSSLPDNLEVGATFYGAKPNFDIKDYTGRRALERAGIAWKPFLKEDKELSKYQFDLKVAVEAEFQSRKKSGAFNS